MNETKKSGLPLPVLFVIGAGMMVGGWYFSKNPPASLANFYHSLEAQGIPLDFGKTISALGVFFMLFGVIRKFYFDPLDEAIDARTNELETTFSEAESLRADMNKMRTDYESRLAQTEAEAREQIQAQVREAQELGKQLRTEAAAQAEEMKRNAIAEIESEREKVMRDLQIRVVNLTLQATEKLLGENVDSEKNRKLVEEFIEKVEVPR